MSLWLVAVSLRKFSATYLVCTRYVGKLCFEGSIATSPKQIIICPSVLNRRELASIVAKQRLLALQEAIFGELFSIGVDICLGYSAMLAQANCVNSTILTSGLEVRQGRKPVSHVVGWIVFVAKINGVLTRTARC